MRKLFKTLAAAGAALALAQPAQAATIVCGGDSSLTQIGQTSGGFVNVVMSFGSFYICDVSAAANGVSAETCQTWLAELLAARGMNKPVTFYFDTAHAANANMTSCASTNFGGATRVPFHIQIVF